MTTHLYKVSPPRKDNLFSPSAFWHTPDWESSTDKPRAGYLQDEVLYAGDFDEVSIHLFPRVRAVRVRSIDADLQCLSDIGLQCDKGMAAYICFNRLFRQEIEAFTPTIFTFDLDGFVRVRRGEYISRKPQRAISEQIVNISEAVVKWNIQVIYVDDLDDLTEKLRVQNIYFDEQR